MKEFIAHLFSKRNIVIAGCFIVLIILIWVSSTIHSSYVSSHWNDVRLMAAEKDREYVQSKFHNLQDGAFVLSEKIFHDKTFCGALNQPDSVRRSMLFPFFAQLNPGIDWTIEYYDSTSHLIAWNGRSIPLSYQDLDSARFRKLFTSISQSTVYTYISILRLVEEDGEKSILVVSRALETTYPINNRFLVNTSFRHELSEKLQSPVQFYFDHLPAIPSDSVTYYPNLLGIDGMVVGVANITPADEQEYLASIHHVYIGILQFIVFLFSLAAGIECVRKLKFSKRSYRYIIILVLLWGIRWLWVVFEIPQTFWETELFGPHLFASPFGFGLVRSLGDLFITILTFFISIILCIRLFLDWIRSESIHLSKWLYALIFLFTQIFLLLLLRAYAATIWSTVYDSTILFNDPTQIIPSLDTAVMETSLLMLTVTFIVVMVVGMIFILDAASRMYPKLQHRLLRIVVLGFVILTSIIFGFFPFTQLVSQTLRLIIFLGTFFAALWFKTSVKEDALQLKFRYYSVLLLSAIGLLLIVRDQAVHERDRDKVQALALELLRPADSWVEQVLMNVCNSIKSENELATLLRERTKDNKRTTLAFGLWAKSVLSREGYNSAIVLFDTSKNIISQFDIGIQSVLHLNYYQRLQSLHAMNVSPGKVISSRATGDYSLFESFIEITDSRGAYAGSAYCVIASSQRATTRGEDPEFLQRTIRPILETSRQQLIISEYHDGELLSVTGELQPPRRSLPVEATLAFRSSESPFIWISEKIDDNSYRTLYIQLGKGEQGNALAISVLEQDARWYLFMVAKLILFITFLSLLFVGIGYVITALRFGRPRISYRTKLQIGLLSVSLVPLLLLSYANRYFMLNQYEKVISRELGRELDVVATNLLALDINQGETPNLQLIDDARCEQVATVTGIDFHLYRDGQLEATSRPDLFVSELSDLRINAGAYDAIMQQEKNYFSEQSNIGSSSSLTVYRPLRDREGNVAAIIAIPTMARQTGIAQDINSVNTFLFAGFFIVACIITILGSVLAHRITLQLRSLTQATKDIALGNFRVALPASRNDEIGDLVHSFNAMAEDLQESREQLAKAERELAWKEMAKQVAHEIKNPLTPMKLSIQHLRQAYEDKTENFGVILQRVTKTIIEQIEVLTRIASEFSHFGRMPQRKFEECEITSMLDDAIALFQDEKRIVFQKNYIENMQLVTADRQELQRAFVNVLRNAVQAISGTGTITISARIIDGVIKIDFQDSGIGIPPENLPRLFEPTFSTKTDGMGLGMALVKKTVDDLHGSIEIESEVGKGTKVTISISL